MFTDSKAKKKSTKAKKKLDCLNGRLINNKILSKIACKPKIRIIVAAIGFGEIKLIVLYKLL